MSNLVWKSYWGSADISTIRNFELRIGKRFPREFVEIVEKCNGAYIVGRDAYKFHCAFTGRDEVYGIGLFHAFGETNSLTDTMLWSFDHRPYGFPDHLVSFSRDGAGNLLCFDYGKNAIPHDPSIVLWAVAAPPGSGKEISLVATNFSELLDMLFEE